MFSTSFSVVRSRRWEVFCKKGVLRNFAKFTGKHLCQSLFFNKVECTAAFYAHFVGKHPEEYEYDWMSFLKNVSIKIAVINC